ncbi:MAG: hypothetical protein BRD25_04170 [Bacteroidetes bacterium QH_1_61_8]|nr:MAG: hypothetical protein BRD25_04170 [Bacteroidetes bacterium QH_1_61_8]
MKLSIRSDVIPDFLWPGRGRALMFGAILVLLGGGIRSVQAQKVSPDMVKRVYENPVPYEPDDSYRRDCGLRKREVDAFVSRRPTRVKSRRKQATINVTYSSDFPDEAVAAYERAVSIWEAHIDSDVEIRIDAGRIQNPAPNVLGGTTPSNFWVIETDGGDQFIAGDALTDALTGTDVGEENLPEENPEEEVNPPDMDTNFNFDRDDWHFGEGDAPSGQLDFTTVALHEIGHGLHYLSLCRYQENQGTGKCTFELSDGSRAAGIYTESLFEQDNDELAALTNESIYPDSSQELGNALTGDQLVFTGERTDAVADARSSGPVPPKVYAPFNYQAGSSISHLNEATYPSNSENALMTPTVEAAETNRNPGPIVCGQLADVGWPLASQCNQFFQNFVDFRFKESSETDESSVMLDWEAPDGVSVREYRIEVARFGGDFETVKSGFSSTEKTISNLGLGRFSFRVRWIANDGSENVSLRTLSKTINLEEEDLTAERAGRDEQGRATVELGWNVPDGTPESFSYRVERAPRGNQDFRTIGTTSQRAFTARGQTPGQYEYRIVSEDGNGNTLSSDTKPVDIDFEGSVFITGPFPNPTQNQATVELTAKEDQDVTVEVFNTLGERLFVEERELVAERPVRLDFNSVDWRRWGSGMYIIRISGREFTKTREMVVVR